MDIEQHDPLRPHAHEPNPEPPSKDASFMLSWLSAWQRTVTAAELQALNYTEIPNCYIVSTGHGTSGPFTFGGVTLKDFLNAYGSDEGNWSAVEVISGDGFGTRVTAVELTNPDPAGPILLSYTLNGRPLTRRGGLVRLIVPNEKEDALRQVKWIGQVRVVG